MGCAPSQVAQKVASVVKEGFRNITYFPHPLPGEDPMQMIRRFSEEVMPVVEEIVRH